jgi:NADPH2:quinone reductase
MSQTRLPSTMKVASIHQQGAAAFRIEEVATPTPGPGQVLIRVESAAVNFSDIKRRRGDTYPFPTEFPFVPGSEIAGKVVAHGPGVSGPPIGTDVFALAGPTGYGGYAQFAVSYAPSVVPMPPGLSHDVASVLTVAGATAKIMLTHAARLQTGETVLIPAATGGVGSFALQIAKQLGAGKIIALVGHASKEEQARALGADDVVVASATWSKRVRALTDGKGVDVALEATGGAELESTLACLASFGRAMVYGAASGNSGTLTQKALDQLLYAPCPNQSLSGFNIGSWFMERPQIAGPALGALVGDVLGGTIKAPAIKTLPLARAEEAHALLEGRKVTGKLVLKPWA